MMGAMVAARFETALLCLAVATTPLLVGGAGFPRRWVVGLGIGMTCAIALNLYLTPGRSIGGPILFGRAATREGLELGALIAVRLAAAAAAIQGLRRVWPGERAADEFARLLAPLQRLRVPVRESRAMIALALRFAPLLVDEAGRIAKLQDLRAGHAPRGVRERIMRRRAALIPSLIAALERADRTALALEARHYRMRPIPGRARGEGGGAVAAMALAGTALFWRR
jgi:energy-coupling factor transporter transmembrane protein EcfT